MARGLDGFYSRMHQSGKGLTRIEAFNKRIFGNPSEQKCSTKEQILGALTIDSGRIARQTSRVAARGTRPR